MTVAIFSPDSSLQFGKGAMTQTKMKVVKKMPKESKLQVKA